MHGYVLLWWLQQAMMVWINAPPTSLSLCSCIRFSNTVISLLLTWSSKGRTVEEAGVLLCWPQAQWTVLGKHFF